MELLITQSVSLVVDCILFSHTYTACCDNRWVFTWFCSSFGGNTVDDDGAFSPSFEESSFEESSSSVVSSLSVSISISESLSANISAKMAAFLSLSMIGAASTTFRFKYAYTIANQRQYCSVWTGYFAFKCTTSTKSSIEGARRKCVLSILGLGPKTAPGRETLCFYRANFAPR